MTNAPYISLALMLAACGTADAPVADQQSAVAPDTATVAPTIAAAQAAPTPPAKTVAAPPTQPSQAWAGEYAEIHEGAVRALITPSGAPDRYTVAVEVSRFRDETRYPCHGEVSGEGRVRNNVLTMTAEIPMYGGSPLSCRIDFRQSDNGLSVVASEGCQSIAGACALDGDFRRIASAGGR